MQPTTKLRWLVKQNQITADEVREYCAQHGSSMAAAMLKLKDAKPPVLQQWWITEGTASGEASAAEGEWRDIPVVVEAP